MSGEEKVFDGEFWIEKLRGLRYPVRVEELDVSTLVEQRSLPKDFPVSNVSRLYSDDYVEVALVEFGGDLSRSACTRAARVWKENRTLKPLLLFTDGRDGFAIIIPGRGLGGEAKVLRLSERIYHTGNEILEFHLPLIMHS